ncbi:hypothetical protein [Brevundimonas sp. SPF441]|uniref:hypothetical protein n=1 Tax=Brevundimonas sp. SPF441 TaxID=2663795 RepID=UPI00129E1895|nr:hypothetical protein [Brevundimonas sp. SPF441]MRL69781.1 hypothetical protein [Brevundimonas sp. SPF441]
MPHFLTLIVVAFIVVGLLAMVLRPVTPKAPFVDKDQDGEPDEPNGPARDL